MRGERRDGLTGQTAAQRAAIERRIALVRAAKGNADDQELRTIEVARALAPAAEGTPEKICSRCHALLPETDDYFYRYGSGKRSEKFRSECKTCVCRINAPYGTTEAARQRRLSSDGRRDRDREWQRLKRAANREAGIPRPPRTARQMLMDQRRDARKRFKRATDPEKRARLQARIENLTHEIERIDRQQAI